MKRIYTALAIYSTVFFLGTAFMGWRLSETQDPGWKSWHLQAGVFVAIFVVFVQSLIFIHLLGTGLGVKRAIDEHGLPESGKAELYRIKMRAFPPAMLSMVATIATAVFGGVALVHHDVRGHVIAGAVALVSNLLTFPIVIRQLGLNEAVMRRTETGVAARAARLAAPRDPAPL